MERDERVRELSEREKELARRELRSAIERALRGGLEMSEIARVIAERRAADGHGDARARSHAS